MNTKVEDKGPVMVPFKGPFPTEVLTMIIKHIDYSLLPTCLRVSKHFFKHAGKYLYSDLVIDYENDGLNVLRVEPESGRKHFKSQLLKHVKSIVIRPHTCPTQKAPRAALTKAARYMTNLERVILMPASDFFATSPLCHEERGCPIVAGLKSKSLTIGGISVDGTDDGPLELFTNILNKAEHATLIVPPTSFYMGTPGFPAHLRGRPEDLAYPTKHLKSVRLIVGISEMDLMIQSLDRPMELSSMAALQEFLAEFINLNPTEIEIYISNDFEGTLDLDQFEEELDTKIETHYNDSIKYLTENNKLEPKYSDWTAKYQLFGLEDYFDQPKLHYELDDLWMEQWDMELWDRRMAMVEKLKEEQAVGDNEASQNPAVSDGDKVKDGDKSETERADESKDKVDNEAKNKDEGGATGSTEDVVKGE